MIIIRVVLSQLFHNCNDVDDHDVDDHDNDVDDHDNDDHHYHHYRHFVKNLSVKV
jgi:hypothetical protein